jgi:hypothetical protein
MYSVVQPRLVVLNSVLAIKDQQPVGILMVPMDRTLFLAVRQTGGQWEITGPSTMEGRELMVKLVKQRSNGHGKIWQIT